MTREEEKYTTLDTEQCKWWVNHLFNIAKEEAFNSHNFDDALEIQSAQDKIIKVLEQESILDKIITEIEEGQMYEGIYGIYIDRAYVLDIIDKYKSESENKVGHWYKANSYDICYTCSFCGVTNASGTKYNYCPHCGSRMEVQND